MRKSAQACGLLLTISESLCMVTAMEARKDPEVRKSKIFNFGRKMAKTAPKPPIFGAFEVPKMGQFELFMREGP